MLLLKSPAAASQILARSATLKTSDHKSSPFVSDLQSFRTALSKIVVGFASACDVTEA